MKKIITAILVGIFLVSCQVKDAYYSEIASPDLTVSEVADIKIEEGVVKIGIFILDGVEADEGDFITDIVASFVWGEERLSTSTGGRVEVWLLVPITAPTLDGEDTEVFLTANVFSLEQTQISETLLEEKLKTSLELVNYYNLVSVPLVEERLKECKEFRIFLGF